MIISNIYIIFTMSAAFCIIVLCMVKMLIECEFHHIKYGFWKAIFYGIARLIYCNSTFRNITLLIIPFFLGVCGLVPLINNINDLKSWYVIIWGLIVLSISIVMGYLGKNLGFDLYFKIYERYYLNSIMIITFFFFTFFLCFIGLIFLVQDLFRFSFRSMSTIGVVLSIVVIFIALYFRKSLILDNYIKFYEKHFPYFFILNFVSPLLLLLIISRIFEQSIIIFGISFFSLNGIYWLQREKAQNLESNLEDIKDESISPKSKYEKTLLKINKQLINGKFLAAFCNYIIISILWKKKKEDKAYLKTKCKIIFRLKKYNKIIKVVESAPIYSETLLNYKVMSFFYLDKINEALELLESKRKKKEFQNAHLYFSLGYLYWHKDDLNSAIEFTEKAKEIDPNCPVALNYYAHYLCDEALLKFRDNIKEFAKKLDEAEKEFNDLSNSLKNEEYQDYCSIKHTEGYIHLLKREFKKAIDCFIESVLTQSHIGSRFHLGLILMIGSEDFYKAEFQFRRILNLLRNNKSQKYYKLAQRNLRRIDVARRKGIVFNNEIIFHYLDKEDIPDVTISREPEKEFEFNKRYFKLNFRSFVRAFTTNILSPQL